MLDSGKQDQGQEVSGDIAAYLESIGAKQSAGTEMVLDCPRCGKGGRLYVNVEDGEGWDGKKKPAGRFICFACGWKSLEFAGLLAELDGVTFSEARAVIGRWKMGGIKLKRPQVQAAEASPDPNAPWLPPEFESVLKVWPKYLTNREISAQTAERFSLGVCRRHIKCKFCKGASCSYNMSNRIILPIECPAGRSYQARTILKDVEPRYLSGDNSGQLLFGWHTIAETDFAVIVEGPFDAIKVVQAGLPSVALMGKQIRDSQMEMLRKRRRKYVVAFDPIVKDPLAIDNACVLAEYLDGLVVVDLTTDPGASREGDIIKAVESAISPYDARMLAHEHRLATLRSRRR